MKVLLLDWNSYGNLHMEREYAKRGYEVVKFPFDSHLRGEAKSAQIESLREALRGAKPDYLFTFNYFPEVSNLCQEEEIPLLGWIYDSPFLDLYSYTVLNSVNHLFVFDYGVYQQFEAAGISMVHYLPMAVDAGELERICGPVDDVEGREPAYRADISLVGSLYTEPKHRLYDKFAGLPAYTKGYLDALIEAQKHIYGENILERLLTPNLVEEMEKVYPTDPNPTSAMTPAQIYSQYVLSRQVTSLERTEILTQLGTLDISFDAFANDTTSGIATNVGWDRLERHLYTNDKSVQIPGWKNKGPVDYYDAMPQVFASSKINLNITLRSILTGIPLRAFDICGAGGFLLTNYQAEFMEYFVPEEDFVFYNDLEDLRTKVEYYLTHDKERRAIAANGCRKVREEHTFAKRIDVMESYLI